MASLNGAQSLMFYKSDRKKSNTKVISILSLIVQVTIEREGVKAENIVEKFFFHHPCKNTLSLTQLRIQEPFCLHHVAVQVDL